MWLKKPNQARKKKSDESYTPVAPLMTLDCRAWIKTLGCMLWTVHIPALRLQKDLTPKGGDDMQNKALAEVALGWSWYPTLTNKTCRSLCLALGWSSVRTHWMSLAQDAKLSTLPPHIPLTFFIWFPLSEQKCCMRDVGLCVNKRWLYLINIPLEKSNNNNRKQTKQNKKKGVQPEHLPLQQKRSQMTF